ncbi:MAG: hypothetical protein K5888_11825 [Lachnospiraceae bacterium]|nr:hypothetical protein [Lachnospiraceae bacterium]
MKTDEMIAKDLEKQIKLKTDEMTAKDLENEIKQKIEVENKNALKALKDEQRKELKLLRAELAKKKRQEFAKTVDEVGIYFISKFDKDGHHNDSMTAEDYKGKIDRLIEFYKSNKDRTNANETREY